MNHRKHTCTLKNQRKVLVEKIVLYVLDDLTHNSALRLLIAERCYAYHQGQNNDNGAYEASIKNQLKDVEGKLANIMKALEAGIFNDTTAERMKVLENQKSMLNDALLAEQNRKKCDLTLNDIVKFLDGLIGDVNDPDTRRKLLEYFIDRIYVYPDKLALTVHYSDDRRELPFEETARFIENRERITSILDGPGNPAGLPAEMLDGLIGPHEEDPDFFP